MNIEFTGNFTKNPNFGINFEAKIDEERIICIITLEALQDINPDSRYDSVEKQFQDNQLTFEEIARSKIENNESNENKIFINSSDVL